MGGREEMFVLNRLSAKKSETSDSFEKMSQNRSFVSTRLRSKPSANQSSIKICLIVHLVAV